MNGRPPPARFVRRAAALIVALVTLFVVMLTAAALMRSIVVVHRQSRTYQNELQAQWLAEAALSRAAARLAKDAQYAGETWQPEIGAGTQERGAATIRVEPVAGNPQRRAVAVTALYPNHELQRASVSREMIITIRPERPSAGGDNR